MKSITTKEITIQFELQYLSMNLSFFRNKRLVKIWLFFANLIGDRFVFFVIVAQPYWYCLMLLMEIVVEKRDEKANKNAKLNNCES